MKPLLERVLAKIIKGSRVSPCQTNLAKASPSEAACRIVCSIDLYTPVPFHNGRLHPLKSLLYSEKRSDYRVRPYSSHCRTRAAPSLRHPQSATHGSPPVFCAQS